MKKLLLFIFSVLVSIGTWAEGSTGLCESPNVTITTNDDPDLESFTGYLSWNLQESVGLTKVIANGGITNIKIKGSISSKGLTAIYEAMKDTYYYGGILVLDLTETSFTDGIPSVSEKINKIIFAPGTTLPEASVLATGTNLLYAYSADDTEKAGVEINLYVGKATSLSEIPELTESLLNTTGLIVNLSGDANGNIKTALDAKDNITVKTPAPPVDKTTCYIYSDSENVESVVKKYLQDNITDNRIRRIMFVAGEDGSTYKLTSADITYMKDLNVGILNMANASYDENIEWDFPNVVEELIMPKGDAISHAEFGDLKYCTNLKYAVDGDFTRLYLPNKTDDAGFFTESLLSEVPTDIVNSVQGVAISGPINVKAFGNVKTTFTNATMFNLYSAQLYEGSTLKDYCNDIKNQYTHFVAPANTPEENLEGIASCTNVGCAYSVLDTGTFYILIVTNDRHNLDIAKYESEKTKRAVFVNGNQYEGQGTATNADVIAALNKTKHIESVDFSQVPMANKDGEISNDTDEILAGLSSTECGIKYVILPSSCTITKTIYDDTPSVEVVVRRSNANKPMEVYHKKAGNLASLIKGVTEVEDRVDVTCLVNSADIAALKNVPGRRINLAECQLEEGTDLSELTFVGNENVEYVLLPNGITEVSSDMFSNCINFKSACSFYDSDNDGKLDAVSAYVKEPGSLATTVALGYTNCNVDFLKHATISGNLNGADITKNGNHQMKVPNGDGSTKTEDLTGALQNSILETLDLSKATFANYEVKDDVTVVNTGAIEQGYKDYTNGLTEISSHAATLTELKLPETDGTTFLPNHAIYTCNLLESLIVPDNFIELGCEAINSCNKLASLQINGVRTLNVAAISGNTALTKLILPTGLKNISDYCFTGCTALKELRVPEGVETIGVSAFNQLNIAAISLPSTLERIEKEAFQQCLSLKSITIPANVEYIGSNVFFNCSTLKDVYVLGDGTKPVIEYNAFSYNQLCGGGTGVTVDHVKETSSEGEGIKGYATDEAYYDGVRNNPLTFFHFPIEHADKYTMPTRNAKYEYIAVTDLNDCENTKVTEVSWNSESGDAEYNDDYYLRRPSVEDLSKVQAAYVAAQEVYTKAEKEIEPSVDWWKYFALVDAYETGNDNSTVWTVRHIKDDTWYTMCMPFDITYDQMDETFDFGYELAYFAGVKQSGDDIVLDFTIGYDKDKTDNIAAYAGVPYMIHPNRGIEAGTNPIGSHEFVISGVSPDLSKGPYPVTSGGEHVSETGDYLTNYEFIGSYGVKNAETGEYEGDYNANVAIPYGYYFLGLEKDATYPRFYKEMSTDEKRKTGRWTRFTACVRKTGTDSENSQSLGISFGDEEPNTTVVTRIIGIDGTIVDEQRMPARVYGNNVYDINGRMVRLGTTSLEGLSKGVYVVNGKKVSVK